MFLPIIASLVIVYVRIWMINTIFSGRKIKLAITLKVFLLALIIVGSLMLYGYLWTTNISTLQQLNIFTPQYFNLATGNIQNIILFVIYCTIFAVIITVFFKKQWSKILQILLIWSLFFVWIAYGGYVTGINVLILYYLVSAYAEEYMKYSAGNNLFLATKSENTTDLIFFCILIGLGFSAVENILYIVTSLIQHQDVTVVNVLIGRWLVSTLIHIVSTSLIAFIVVKMKKAKTIFIPIILGIIAGFGTHSLYNISLNYGLQGIFIPLIILAFFLLTFLLFQSDILYRQKAK